ncbi:MAG: PorP/SprF family type IX secretion system membrane protein [Bacteroidota bacterium]
MTRYVKIRILLLCFALPVNHMLAQDAESFAFYFNPVQANPALAGSEGPGKLRLMYRDYYPGKGLNLFSVSSSYDSYLESIHGGFGIYVSENLLGDLLSDLRAGAAYSYHLRASRDLYINAGFLASVIHRGMDAGRIVLPDQLDPIMGAVLPSGEVIDPISNTVFDAGLGFLFMYRDYHAGIAVNHIFNPDLMGHGFEETVPGRRLSVHCGAVFNTRKELRIMPGFIINVQNGNYMGAMGASVGYNMLSFNILPFFDLRRGLSYIQSGLYLETGMFELAYNYNFTPLRTGNIQPLTLSNQVSLAITLFNSEKRGVPKTINYPKM